MASGFIGWHENPRRNTKPAKSGVFLARVFFFLLIFASLSNAQPLNISGYLKFFAHPNLNAPYPFDRLGTRLQLTLERQMGSRADVFASFDFNVEETRSTGRLDEPRSATTQVYPVETYIDIYFTHFDIRLGKQFIFWGTTDWINPTDNINPWDFVNIAAEIEDYRIAVTAAKAAFYIGENWVLEGVWIPRFSPHKIPLTFPDSLGPFPAESRQPLLPENKLTNSEAAFRAASQLWNIDFSFSYYRGFDKSPSVLITPEYDHNFLPVRFVFEPRYFPMHVFGMDFVTTFNKFSVKGEGAYFLTDDRRGTNVFVENPHIQYVVGSDYNVNDDLSVNLQFAQTIRLKYTRQEEIRRYQNIGNPNPDPPEKYTQSLTGRVHYRLGSFTDIQVIAVVNLQDRDFFLLPILTHSLADGLNVFAGATIFQGPPESPFGRSKPYSRAFVELKFSF